MPLIAPLAQARSAEIRRDVDPRSYRRVHLQCISGCVCGPHPGDTSRWHLGMTRAARYLGDISALVSSRQDKSPTVASKATAALATLAAYGDGELARSAAATSESELRQVNRRMNRRMNRRRGGSARVGVLYHECIQNSTHPNVHSRPRVTTRVHVSRAQLVSALEEGGAAAQRAAVLIDGAALQVCTSGR